MAEIHSSRVENFDSAANDTRRSDVSLNTWFAILCTEIGRISAKGGEREKVHRIRYIQLNEGEVRFSHRRVWESIPDRLFDFGEILVLC